MIFYSIHAHLLSHLCVCVYVGKKVKTLICNHNNFDPIFFGQEKKNERKKFEFEIKVVRIFLDLKYFKEDKLTYDDKGEDKKEMSKENFVFFFFLFCF